MGALELDDAPAAAAAPAALTAGATRRGAGAPCMSRTRVLVVEHDDWARARLQRLLAACAEFELVRACGDRADALQWIRAGVADVVLVDAQLLAPAELGALWQSGSQARALPVPILVAADSLPYAGVEMPIVQVLLKPFDNAQLLRALRRARRSAGA